MNAYEKILIISILVIWISVAFKYETIAFLSRSKDSENNKETSDRFRYRAYFATKVQRAKDKLKGVRTTPSAAATTTTTKKATLNIVVEKPNQKQSHLIFTIKPQLYHNLTFNNHKTVNDKLKWGNGALVMKRLARKLLNSGHGEKGGQFHNYTYKYGKYSSIDGSVCINNINYNGIEFGHFMCPIDGFDYAATKCCGLAYQQYCCTKEEADDASSGSSPYIGFYNAYEKSEFQLSNHSHRLDLSCIILFLLLLFFI